MPKLIELLLLLLVVVVVDRSFFSFPLSSLSLLSLFLSSSYHKQMV